MLDKLKRYAHSHNVEAAIVTLNGKPTLAVVTGFGDGSTIIEYCRTFRSLRRILGY